MRAVIEHDQRAQVFGPAQAAHPGEYLFQQHAEHQRSLVVVQVRHEPGTAWAVLAAFQIKWFAGN